MKINNTSSDKRDHHSDKHCEMEYWRLFTLNRITLSDNIPRMPLSTSHVKIHTVDRIIYVFIQVILNINFGLTDGIVKSGRGTSRYSKS